MSSKNYKEGVYGLNLGLLTILYRPCVRYRKSSRHIKTSNHLRPIYLHNITKQLHDGLFPKK